MAFSHNVFEGYFDAAVLHLFEVNFLGGSTWQRGGIPESSSCELGLHLSFAELNAFIEKMRIRQFGDASYECVVVAAKRSQICASGGDVVAERCSTTEPVA